MILLSKKFYISDLHIGHKNILKFDQRPFFDLEDMKQTIINNWNSVVSPHDDVYILGDMFWNNDEAADVLSKLKGHLYLIKGNHDRENAEIRMWFDWIKNYAEIHDNGRNVVLCHYPIAHWHNADHGTIHLYGHIHSGRHSRPFEEYVKMMKKRDTPYYCYNVGCMMPYMDYTPRTLDEIINGIKENK